MRNLKLLIPILLLLTSFECAEEKFAGRETEVGLETPEVVVGADRMDQYIELLKGKKIGLLVNQTSLVGKTHLADTLHALGINIVRIFAPEHGFRGDHSAGAHVNDMVDEKTGIPIKSIYGNNRRPADKDIADLDVVIFDIQDVGVRFYTYISSMHYMMEACAENGKKFIVLDRPNPNGFYIDGPVLELEYQSFIGMHPVPLVHGMTAGEFAQMINGQKWLRNQSVADLIVIPCLHYNHDTKYRLPVYPSPNLPNMSSVYLYPSLGLFEGTNVSIGRGTPNPFQMVGRPGFAHGNHLFTPRPVPGVADHPKHEGVECRGMFLQLYGDSMMPEMKRLKLDWLILFYKENKESDGPFFKPVFDKLAGTGELRKQIESNMSEEDIRASWKEGIELFKSYRSKYLLYE